jgi:hypothetical protein
MGDETVTAPAQRTRPAMAPADWNVRHDAGFDAAWLTHLIMRSGEWCRASDLWPPADAYQRAVLRQRAHEVVCGARRLGLHVDADRLLGYRVTGHDGLPKYLHLRREAAVPQASDGSAVSDPPCTC